MTIPADLTLPEGAPEEGITHAILRPVDLSPSGFKGTLALITMDNGLDHTRPKPFGAQSLAALNEAITAAIATATTSRLAASVIAASSAISDLGPKVFGRL